MTPDRRLTTAPSGVTSVHSYYLTSLINLSFCSFGMPFPYVLLKIVITSGKFSFLIILYNRKIWEIGI